MRTTGEVRTYRLDERAFTRVVVERALLVLAGIWLLALVMAVVPAAVRADVPEDFVSEIETTVPFAAIALAIGSVLGFRRARSSARATASAFVLVIGPSTARRTMPNTPDVEVSRDRIVDVRSARAGVTAVVRGGPSLFVPAALIDYADACERLEAWRRDPSPVAADELARELGELRASAPPLVAQPASSVSKTQLVVFAVGWAFLLLMYVLIAYTPLLK